MVAKRGVVMGALVIWVGVNDFAGKAVRRRSHALMERTDFILNTGFVGTEAGMGYLDLLS